MSGPQFDHDQETPIEVAQPAPKKPNKWLTAAFNMASGAVVSLAIKTTIVACTASVLTPALSIGIAAAAAGVGSSYVRHYFENRTLVKAGQEPVKFTFKKAAFGAGFGLLGAGLAAGLMGAFEHFFGGADCPAEKPAVAEAVAEIAPAAPSTMDCVKELASKEGVSGRVAATIERFTSASPRISAQAMKDLGFFLMNGLDGLPKDPCLAIELLKDAAEQGNMQAKIDLAYIEYHGNDAAGIKANPQAAIEKMQELKGEKARWFIEKWTAAASTAPDVSTAPVVEPVISPAPVEAVIDAPAVDPVVSAPAPEVAPISESKPVEDIKAVINTETNSIDFILTVPENDNSFVIGEKITIERPGLLQLAR